MNEMAVSEFKARALEVMSQIAESGEPVTITKWGKPLVQVIPASSSGGPVAGRLRGTVLEEGDIVSPLGADDWESATP
jgi:prevent-host-death family protein